MLANCGRDWLDYTTLAFTIGGVLIVGVYTIVTYLQVILTRRSLEESQKSGAEALAETQKSNEAIAKSNEIAWRALVLGRRAWLIPRLETIEGIDRAELRLTNLGGLPGVIHRVAIVVQPVDMLPAIPPEVTSDDYDPSTTIVFPGTDMILRAEVADLENVGSREILVVYCCVEYTDVFRQP